MECNKHNQPLSLYCPSHLMPSCDPALVEKTKIEKSKVSVEKDINYFLSILDQLVTSKSKNIKTGENHCIGIKKSINEIRKEINKHLDHLEEKLCLETDIIWNQERSKATDFISEIEGKRENLKEMKEHLQTVTTNTSKLQSFLGVYKIEQQVHQCQRYIEDLEDDERTKEVDIKMKRNGEIENILSKLVSLESLGKVIVDKTEINLNKETSLRRKAQVKSQEQSNINNITMNIETKIDINIWNFIRDMICLIDGRVIVVECDGKVNLLSSDGKLQKQLPIPGLNKDEIRIIDLEGNTLKSIQVQSESYLNYLVYCDKRVIYSDYEGKAVYCVDDSGKQIWEYKQDLTGPQGLCIDTYGNIIAADCDSHRIIVISKDGQDSKVLISKEDGLEYPKCICFKHNESSGFICDYKGRYLAKFNLSCE
ncbi:unnamed protein product [Mytilus edulis]|uniref:TRIM2_3 n=1 Tax=Mytilus edulis TaxID=6550 RepID=A0A8S3RMR5_MYTED|nr:unnamed protein product [Mytilus edulis]